jgi:hypothetical protein
MRVPRSAFVAVLALGLCPILVPLSSATRVPIMAAEELIRKSGAVFIGTVAEVDPTCRRGYDPCTSVTFSDVEIVAGRLPEGELTFRLAEGQMADGTTLGIAGAPQFLAGQRYLIFARAGDWFNTPVTNWFNSVFRELRIGKGVSVFVNYQGRAVQGVTEQGFTLGKQLAPPDEMLALNAADPAARRSEMMASEPPEGDKQDGFAQHGDFSKAMPKEDLMREIQKLVHQYGLAVDQPVRLSPPQSGPPGDQEAAVAGAPGLEPAAPDPSARERRVKSELPPSDTPEFTQPRQLPDDRLSNPGRELPD